MFRKEEYTGSPPGISGIPFIFRISVLVNQKYNPSKPRQIPESHVNAGDPNKTKGSIRDKFSVSGRVMVFGLVDS